MNYFTIKLIHLSCVALSFSLFFVRGIWSLQASPMLQQRWVKIAPHIIDSGLFASALMLAIMIGATPFNSPWLLAKIVALLLYIVLGTFAIKRGKTHSIKLLSWLAAQVVFFYIVATAINHNPIPWQ